MKPAAPRRVAIVHDWLTGMRGGEMVLEQILGILPDADIFTLFHFPGTVSRTIETRPIHTSYLQHAPLLRRYYRWYLPFFPRAIESLDLGGYDLVVSSSHCVAKGALAAPDADHLCYCHTPVRYAWDQEEAYFPQRRGPLGRIRSAVLARLRRWDVATANRPRRILANSRFVADRIRRYWQRDAEVLHPPVDTDFFTPGEGESGRYALAVSAPAPYKRIAVAASACAALGLELRVVGIAPDSPVARASEAPAVWLGRVSPERLRALYRGALAFVQPGVEDFGIAAVEALACGTPIAAVGEGGVLDIVADEGSGVLYLPSAGAAGLSGALDKIQKNRFNKMKLREQAETFSHARFRERFEKVLA